MAFLLDTNVVSETIKPRPAESVLRWIGSRRPSELYLAAITIGELVRGARKAREVEKRERFKRQIASTAIQYRLVVVTRNVRDFLRFDVELLNPSDD